MGDVFTSDTLEHRCPDGHDWREHTNGQVTPSWGYGGTFIDVADPSRCPEPASDPDGLYLCDSCGQRHRPGDGLRSLSSTPWEYGDGPGKRPECAIPRPACGAAAVWTRRWGDRHLPWPDEGPGALYTIWRLEQRGYGERLVCYLGGVLDGGNAALDLHSGELLTIPPGDGEWNPTGTRKATLNDVPGVLRREWPRPKSASESGVDAPWLLARVNPDYQALVVLHAEGLLGVAAPARQFTRVIKTAATGAGLEAAIRRRVSDGQWQIADLDALLAAHRRVRARLADEQARHAPAPDVQLTFGI
jgi:hypothetical protein